MYVDDEDDEVAHEPGTNGFNGLSNGLHKPVTVRGGHEQFIACGQNRRLPQDGFTLVTTGTRIL